MTTNSGEPPFEMFDGLSDLETALKQLIANRPLPLYRMMGYHMGWVDANGEQRNAPPPLRVHGALALTTCRALGADQARALPHACAVEYLYNHTLIHDDIRDGNSERGGRASVWWSWGPAQAINTGDGMHALARLALFETRSHSASPEAVSDSLRVLDEANLDTCEGQYRDINLQERLDVGVEEYLAMAESQTGALLTCAVRLGALAAGVRDDTVHSGLNQYGRKLGAAVRVADDYAVFWPEGERGDARQGRLVAKKKTLPVAHAIETGSPTDRRIVGEIYMERVLDPSSAKRLTEALDSTGSREFSAATMARLVEEAITALREAELPAGAVDALSAAAKILATPAGTQAGGGQ